MMSRHRIFTTKFASVYPHYVQKAERKQRTKAEVDQIICWLTGYGPMELQQQIEGGTDFETFFAQAPAMNPNAALITGVVCGVRVEDVEDPLMQKIRYLDKLIDELAKGKAMGRILRHALGLVIAAALGAPACLAQTMPANASDLVVQLSRVPDDQPTPYYSGLTNIFFEPLAGVMKDSVSLHPDWSNPEIAGVVESPSLQAIRAVRFRAGGDTAFRYVLDTAGTLDFTNGVALRFAPVGNMMVADTPLRIRSMSGPEVFVPLQVMYTGKYTYARIAEARVGQVTIGGVTHVIRVHPRSRNNPFYSLGTGTRFLVDLDGDGRLAESAAQMINGRPIAAEEVQPDIPFSLGGTAYEVTSIDSIGMTLVLRRSTRTVAVAPGFKPPSFQARDLSGKSVVLRTDGRRPTLLEFWSIECPYSEAVREKLNGIYGARRDRMSWIAMSRETDHTAVSQFVRDKPRTGAVVLGDSVTWHAFNPITVTPLFVLLDAQGRVAYAASGANVLPAIEAKLDELMKQRR